MKGEDFKNGDTLAKWPDGLLACTVLAATCQCCQYFVAEVNSVCGGLFGFFCFLLIVWFLCLGKDKHLELFPCVPLSVSQLRHLGKYLLEGSGRALVQQ